MQHVTNRQDPPPLAECVPSGVHVPIAGAETRAEVQSEGVTCSSKVVRTSRGPTRGCQGAIHVHGDDRFSSSSASSPTNRGKERVRKTCAAQHEVEGRVAAAAFLQEKNPLRGDQRDTRAQAVEHGGLTYPGGFGTDIANRGVLGRVQSKEAERLFAAGRSQKAPREKRARVRGTPCIRGAKRYAGIEHVAKTFADL